MARFTSIHASLSLQGDGDAAPYARFVEGVFETSDEAVVERLRAISDGTVTEAADEPAAEVEDDDEPAAEVEDDDEPAAEVEDDDEPAAPVRRGPGRPRKHVPPAEVPAPAAPAAAGAEG